MSGTPDTTTPVAPEPDDICLRACQPCEGCGQHIPKERTPPLCSKCAPVGREVTTTPAVTEEDRAKAAEVVPHHSICSNWRCDCNLTKDGLRDAIAVALAARGAEAAALRAAMNALAEELEAEAEHCDVRAATYPQSGPWALEHTRIATRARFSRRHAARLRAIADGQR